ncbi:MAG: BT_3928 family protein [Salinivirgaceae bacterium]
MANYKNLLIWTSRIIVGIVFIYSGFVKGVDPLGSMYKFNDYFNAFGMSWASAISLILALLLSTAEFIIGVGILLNLKIKHSTWGAMLLMAVFTPLTLVLALTNPVSDCGCFGDALVLTNWQTFWKNVVLLIPLLFLFLNKEKITNRLSCTEQWASAGFFTLIMLSISWYSLNNLPVLDFRPYKVGTYIPDGMVIPEGAPADVWESVFVYSKNGEEKEFSLDNLPDSSWAFVDAKHNLISKGYEPPIHDLTMIANDGSDMSELILASPNYNFLMISHNLEKANTKNIAKMNQLAAACRAKGYGFYLLTASGDEGLQNFFRRTEVPSYDILHTDEITLKTMVRSNPGLMVIKEGTIINKWSHRNIPDPEQLHESVSHSAIIAYKKMADKYYIYTLILLGGLLTSSYLQLRKKWAN